MLKLINDRQVMHRSELELLEKIFNFQFESKELIHAVKELDISWATFRTVQLRQNSIRWTEAKNIHEYRSNFFWEIFNGVRN